MSLSVAPVRVAPMPIRPKVAAKPAVVKAVPPAQPHTEHESGVGHLLSAAFSPLGSLWHRVTNSTPFKVIAELSFWG